MRTRLGPRKRNLFAVAASKSCLLQSLPNVALSSASHCACIYYTLRFASWFKLVLLTRNETQLHGQQTVNSRRLERPFVPAYFFFALLAFK